MFKIQKRHYQRLTSNFFLSHYVHNNISTDNFATKIRSRWSIEFYAKSFQRWHNAPIIFPTCVRIIFTTYESFLSYVKFIIIWRLKEKNGKQKKRKKIYQNSKNDYSQNRKKFFRCRSIPIESTLSIEFISKVSTCCYSGIESIDKIVNTIYCMYRCRYYNRR